MTTKSKTVKGKLLVYLYFEVYSDGTTDESVYVRGNRMGDRIDEVTVVRTIRQELERQDCEIRYSKI